MNKISATLLFSLLASFTGTHAAPLPQIPGISGGFNPITAVAMEVPVVGSAAFLTDHFTGHADAMLPFGPKKEFGSPAQQNAYITGYNHQKDTNDCLTLKDLSRCVGILPTNGLAGIANTMIGVAPNDPNSPATWAAKAADALLGKTPRKDKGVPPANAPGPAPAPGQQQQPAP
ncbi:hypothetical protein HK102_008552, partial [Quaeritorhiza haematococci]